jgi:hypothetical protein
VCVSSDVLSARSHRSPTAGQARKIDSGSDSRNFAPKTMNIIDSTLSREDVRLLAGQFGIFLKCLSRGANMTLSVFSQVCACALIHVKCAVCVRSRCPGMGSLAPLSPRVCVVSGGLGGREPGQCKNSTVVPLRILEK